MMFNDFGKRPPQFGDATAVANAILESGHKFDEGMLIYNKFRYSLLTPFPHSMTY